MFNYQLTDFVITQGKLVYINYYFYSGKRKKRIRCNQDHGN